MAKENEKKQKQKTPTPLKRDMQSEKRRLRNRSYKASVRTTIRSLEECLVKNDAAGSKSKLSDVYSVLDKGVKHGILKQNTVNRTKARLTARVAKVSV
jgi:small subunit ribosomal protein S20